MSGLSTFSFGVTHIVARLSESRPHGWDSRATDLATPKSNRDAALALNPIHSGTKHWAGMPI